MARHEQAVIDSINRYFERQASALGRTVRSFALDGQDTVAGADYILTDRSQFALIEFKYTQAEIIDESQKPKRMKLCEKLEISPHMKKLHDNCHFIAWTESTTKKAMCNIYRLEVCNQKIWGSACCLPSEHPSTEHRILAGQFTAEFFSGIPPRSLCLSEFEDYVKWLLQVVSGSSKRSFELLTYDDTSDECAMIEFSSVRAAYDWMQRQKL